MSSNDEYEAWKREREKETVLDVIDKKGTLDISQVSDILNKPIKEIEPIVAQLANEKLIKSDIGNYYHLTFEGERLLSNIRGKKNAFSQQR
jgi:predicted transcriptional regulator